VGQTIDEESLKGLRRDFRNMIDSTLKLREELGIDAALWTPYELEDYPQFATAFKINNKALKRVKQYGFRERIVCYGRLGLNTDRVKMVPHYTIVTSDPEGIKELITMSYGKFVVWDEDDHVPKLGRIMPSKLPKSDLDDNNGYGLVNV